MKLSGTHKIRIAITAALLFLFIFANLYTVRRMGRGLAAALAECCISDRGNMVGAQIDKLNYKMRPDALLFGEAQSRIILSCGRESAEEIRKIALKFKAPFQVIGKTGGRFLKVLQAGKELICLPLQDLSKEWSSSLKKKIEG